MTTVQDIINNNGATLNKRGDMVTLKSGYQVSCKDLGRVAIADFTQEMVSTIVSYGLKRGQYAGFWVEDGYVYADISVRKPTKQQALTDGKALNQISIWQWNKGKAVYC